MNLSYLQNNQRFLLLNCISGSHSYGLSLPTSDTDYKGVFILPKTAFYSLEYTEQVTNETNDIVYYEVGRFIDLLVKNNPNILELLYTPHDCVLYRHPALEKVKPEIFLSKLCKDTFAGYAMAQVKRAKGLNKKIVNPVDKELKTVLDFCFVPYQQGSIPVNEWLHTNGYKQEDCGLVHIAHMRDTYALYHKSQLTDGSFLPGLISGNAANDVQLSSIPKGLMPLTILQFNKDGYSRYCRDYKDYWEWVKKRNETRYQSTLEHGKNYDAKNMMHVFRLLNTAEEIAIEGRVNVRRADRDFLLRIRGGEFMYEHLVNTAQEKIEHINSLFEKSSLPETADKAKANQLLFEIREELYS